MPMIVVYRLAGIDGEATEDRVESLAEGDEETGNTSNERKFAVTKSLLQDFEGQNGKKTNGI